MRQVGRLRSPLEQFDVVALEWFISPLDGFIILTNLDRARLFLLIWLFLLISWSGRFGMVLFKTVLWFVRGIVVQNFKNRTTVSPFFVFVFRLFLYIVLINFVGLLPFFSTITRQLSYTFMISFTCFCGIFGLGVLLHKAKIFSLFLPSGVPVRMTFFLVPLEIISYFARIISLAVRLCANMVSGHALVKILATFARTLFSTFVGHFMLLAVAGPLAILCVIIGLEMRIALLQAYVFVMLVCLYLAEVVYNEH